MKTNLPEEIKITVDGKTLLVKTSHYVIAKTKQLREFGYSDLRNSEVEAQVLALLKGGKLTVIGMFMQDEVNVERRSTPSKKNQRKSSLS